MKAGDLIMDNDSALLGLILKRENFANMETGPVFLIRWFDPPDEELFFNESWRQEKKITLLSENS